MKKLFIITTLAFSGFAFAEDKPNQSVEFVDTFEKTFGVHQGLRRNHTKGFCFSGTLTPIDSSITALSTSSLFTGDSQVIGRLSHKGGKLNPADTKPSGYGMGLSISTPSGEQHLMSMNTLDFFPVSTPEAFLALMQAKLQGKEALVAFKQKYPEIKQFKAHMAKKDKTLKPYEAMRFNSINSFYLVDADGNKTAVRWSFRPSQQQQIVVEQDHDFFYSNLEKNLNDQGIAWDMVVTLANKNDPIDNAAKQWIGEHKEIVAARLTLNSISTEATGKCEAITYDPLVLPSGIQASADPILHARRSVYAVGFGRRVSEKAAVSTKSQ